MKYKNIAIIAAKNNKKAVAKKDSLVKKYNFKDITNDHKNIKNIDLVVAIGGDGLMLHLLHEYEKKPVPIYGINHGTIGFLMNSHNNKSLTRAIEDAEETIIRPLRMEATDLKGKVHKSIAINEVSILRKSPQAAKIRVKVNKKLRIDNLMCDGILLATSAGSTAYNLSVGGPIIPFDAEILALTPISPFRPRSWKGALLPANSEVVFEIIEAKKRPVSAISDSYEVKNVKKVKIKEDKSTQFKILFDANHSLQERIIREQFDF